MATQYDHLSREELVKLLERRERETPHFGLVWERDEIEHERSLNADFVVLDSVPDLAVGQAPFHNLLIEGPNFDALRYLLMTLRGQVKCILIDPPYNTGNADFIYNDRFVEKEDRYRHSKWLEMMFQSLSLARDLLSDDGVLFVHIGEEEVQRLGCLLDQTMPGRKVSTFVWRRRSGANDAKEFFVSQDHEYVLCYGNPDFSFEGDVKSTSAYSNPDNDERGGWISSDLSKRATHSQRPRTFYPIQNPETQVWYACDPNNVWAYATQRNLNPTQKTRSSTMEQIITEKRVLWPQSDRNIVYDSVAAIEAAIADGSAPRNLRVGNPKDEVDLAFWREQNEFWVGKTIGYGKPRYKRFQSELKRTEKPFSTWFLPAAMKKKEVEQLDLEGVETLTVGYTTEGTSLLQEMLGNKDFPYPKPLSLVQGLIKQSTGPDDIVLDFFAGSGTTGHAVLKQNSEDNGNRRFILVSTTEATEKEPNKNVCRDITQKRLKAAIEGYAYTTNKGRKEVEGLGGNVLYARTRRIPTGKVVRRIAHEQVWLALQLMHSSGVQPFQRPLKTIQVASLQGGSTPIARSLVYVPVLDEASRAWLREALPLLEGEVTLYCWQIEIAAQEISALGRQEKVGIHPIPQTLVERFGAGAKS